ncbi:MULTISPECIES: GlxA family transcriptional regulator [Pseudoalteromonas]|uniref:Helix-turn-helix domain-containing protein n=1 Tax=Pseudoalteromonas viridis TaxID=339617 RepID=A0ABX7V5Y2_9GAMM|nr:MULTISPECIES: helix-turn-helix domain-containing protein [Pseudoalteromonas]QTL34625.1 helix-turn-helix domain-containing protein [Pseudoalteromonas viridis]
MRIVLICPPKVFASALTGVIDIFNVANQVMGKSFFSWKIAALNRELQVTSSQGLTIQCDSTLEELSDYDALVWIGAQYNGPAALWQQCIEVSQAVTTSTTKSCRYHLAGCCGVAYLGATGLLDQHRITASWWLAPFFAKYFPHIDFKADEIVFRSNEVYTAGAAHSYLHLILTFISDMVGKEVAENVASWLAIPQKSSNQNQFIRLSVLQEHCDEQIRAVQSLIDDCLTETLSLKRLAESVYMSERTLIRRFKQHVGMTPMDYVRLVRLEKSKHLLASSNLSQAQIAYQVGYQDPQALARQFKKHFQVSMKAFRE